MTELVTTTLAQCCDIVSGATPQTSVAEYWDGDICWATPKDLSDLDGHFIASTPRKITKAGLSSCAASVLPANSVLFSSRAPIGHVAVNTTPMATNQGFKSFIPRSNLLEPKFLFHWLRAKRPYLESLGNGATFKEVSKAVVARVEIALPPLPEQRRIAAILDQADALRAKRRAALAQLGSLTQSIFIEMFGDPSRNPKSWPETVLSKLVRENDTINYGVVQPGDALDEGIPLVRVGDLVDGEFSSTTLKRIDPIIESAYKRSRLRGDEILVSCVGSIGVTVLATPAMKGFNIARAVARIPLADRANRIFIASYLQTDAVQNYFTAELRTVTQPTLNIKQIAETKVFSPPLALQEVFATRIQAVESLKTTHRAALAESNALFASLQHRAFAGQLSAGQRPAAFATIAPCAPPTP